jgi:hypothetical protein
MNQDNESRYLTADEAYEIAMHSKKEAHSKMVSQTLELCNNQIVEEATEGNLSTRTSVLLEIVDDVTVSLRNRGYAITTLSSGGNVSNIEISWDGRE